MNEHLPVGNVFENISNGCYHFTVAEKKVSEYVLAHKRQVQYMSISELADECGVAEATISRFCRRLRQKGYNAFKLAVAKAVAGEQGGGARPPESQLEAIRPEDSLLELGRKLCNSHTAAIHQSLALIRPERVKEAVDLMRNAQRVFAMGQGAPCSSPCWPPISFPPCLPGFSPCRIPTSRRPPRRCWPPRMWCCFSPSGSTKELMEIMGLAQNSGAKVILVTRFSKSPGAAMADVVLQRGSDEGPLQLGSMPAKMAQLFVLDILFHEYVRRDPGDARRSQERIADALAERHL